MRERRLSRFGVAVFFCAWKECAQGGRSVRWDGGTNVRRGCDIGSGRAPSADTAKAPLIG